MILLHIISGHIRGDGDNREDTGNQSYRKEPLLLQLKHLIFHQSTHTSCPLPWYFWKGRVDNIFLSSFYHALPKFKVRLVSPNFRIEAHWLKCAAPQTKITLVASQHPFCHTILAPHLPRAADLQQRLLSGGPKAGIRLVSRTDVDLPMQTFIKKIYVSFK